MICSKCSMPNKQLMEIKRHQVPSVTLSVPTFHRIRHRLYARIPQHRFPWRWTANISTFNVGLNLYSKGVSCKAKTTSISCKKLSSGLEPSNTIFETPVLPRGRETANLKTICRIHLYSATAQHYNTITTLNAIHASI